MFIINWYKVIMCLCFKIIFFYLLDYKNILHNKKMLSYKDGLWCDHDKWECHTITNKMIHGAIVRSKSIRNFIP